MSTVLSPTEKSRIQGLFKALSDFPVLFKAYLILKDFSRKPSKFKYFSSLCEPWYIIEMAFDAFASRADPDRTALTRVYSICL